MMECVPFLHIFETKAVFPIELVIDALCCVFGFIFLRKQENFWTGFVYFLPFVLLVETTGYVISYGFHKSNHWVYNVYMPVQFIFTGYVLYRVFPYQKKKIWFVWGLLLFIVVYTWESIWGRYTYNSISDTVSSFELVMGCAFYYYFMLSQDDYEDLQKNAAFWFVNGLFLFSFGLTATNLFTEDMMLLHITKNLSLRYVLVLALTVIMDGCWIYAFRCKSQETILS